MPKLIVYSAIMEAVRDAWTDERLDDLANRVDRGFDRVDRDLRELRAELRSEMDSRFGRLENRFDSMQRMTLTAYVTAILGLIATQL
jgi:hypothetical protein